MVKGIYSYLYEIIHQKSDGSAISKENGWIESKGRKYSNCSECDGKMEQYSGFTFKGIRVSNPFQVEYATNAGLTQEAVFAW